MRGILFALIIVLLVPAVLGIFGIFVYHDFFAFFKVGVISISAIILSMIGVIPIGGPLLYVRLVGGIILPKFITSFNLSQSWIILVLYRVGQVLSMIFTCLVCILIFRWVYNRFKKQWQEIKPDMDNVVRRIRGN